MAGHILSADKSSEMTSGYRSAPRPYYRVRLGLSGWASRVVIGAVRAKSRSQSARGHVWFLSTKQAGSSVAW